MHLICFPGPIDQVICESHALVQDHANAAIRVPRRGDDLAPMPKRDRSARLFRQETWAHQRSLRQRLQGNLCQEAKAHTSEPGDSGGRRCDKRWNCAVSAMAMVRLPTTSFWCLSIDTGYSTINKVKKDCELVLYNICMEQGYKIHAIEIVEDHVRLFLEFHPSSSLSKVVQYLKGGSSLDCSSFILN
jgi:hypothetical protein